MLFTEFEKHITNRRGAIHIGANVGEECGWYKDHGFNKVLWFEPNPSLFPILEQNIKGFENNIAFNIGVHDTLKEATLHIANNSGQSSSILPLGTHARRHPKVHYIYDQKIRLVRMDDFLDCSGRDIADYNFLNIDVQGVELNVIKSFGELIKQIDYIYVEVNREELYVGCSMIQDIDAYLTEHNFERMATHWTKNNWGDAFYMKNKKREFESFINPVFIETGSYVGDGIKAALRCGFPKVISIELSAKYYEGCKERFKDNSNVHLYHGNSVDLLEGILSKIKTPCTFWLDAHYCGDTTGNKGVPLMEELEIIAQHPIKTHTILIDDMRLIKEKEAEWVDFPYGIRDIEQFINSINPKYKIYYVHGTAPDDILIARV